MAAPLDLLAVLLALTACAGMVQAIAGYLAVRRFRKRLRVTDQAPVGNSCPPMTILKPLCGDEPLLEAALASICAVEYPAFQVVFGVQDAADPALIVVERLRARFPDCDMALVVDDTAHGSNRKIANLINMLPAARHDLLVIGDSDVHVTPDYLHRIAAEFSVPDTGLVTTLYAGLPADRSLAAALGGTGLSHSFLPGALMARGLGRQDSLGVTMAIRREMLAAVGGLAALASHLADDHVLGALVRKRGLAVRLAATLTSTTVPESTLPALLRHELRWSRTVLSLEPLGFALSAIQFPLFWSAVAWAISGGAYWAGALFIAAWAARASCAVGIDRALGLTRSGLAATAPVWLLPLRDWLSVAVMLASYADDRVEWRGRMMHTMRDTAPTKSPTLPSAMRPRPEPG